MKIEAKREKSLALKALRSGPNEDNIDVPYMEKGFVKSMRKNGQFQRSGSCRRKGSTMKVCHRYGSPKHFIKDCLMYKMGYRDY